jgi:multiple sugar transport system permease protein
VVESRASRRAFRVLQVVLLIVFGIFSFGPILWTAMTAIKPDDLITNAAVVYIPDRITFENFVSVLQDSEFLRLFANSLVVCLLTVILSISIGSVAGYGLSRQHARGRLPLLIFYLSIRMYPAVLVLVPLVVIQQRLGLLNTHLGLALAYTTFSLPLVVWMMKNFFDAVPIEIEDAARVDGCGRIGTFVRITVPLARQGIAAMATLVAIGAWNEFLFALMMTSGDGARTWPVGLYNLIGEFYISWGKLSAAGIIATLPILIVYAIAGRTLIRRLVAGGVSGT